MHLLSAEVGASKVVRTACCAAKQLLEQAALGDPGFVPNSPSQGCNTAEE